jgi:hypothetical protein
MMMCRTSTTLLKSVRKFEIYSRSKLQKQQSVVCHHHHNLFHPAFLDIDSISTEEYWLMTLTVKSKRKKINMPFMYFRGAGYAPLLSLLAFLVFLLQESDTVLSLTVPDNRTCSENILTFHEVLQSPVSFVDADEEESCQVTFLRQAQAGCSV